MQGIRVQVRPRLSSSASARRRRRPPGRLAGGLAAAPWGAGETDSAVMPRGRAGRRGGDIAGTGSSAERREEIGEEETGEEAEPGQACF